MDNLLGEFLGTMVLIVFGCGVNANMSLGKTCGHGGGWICITTGWCFAVLMGVYTSVALGAPQADLNPSVTIAKTLAGVYTWGQFAATSLVQILGGVLGAIIVYLAYLPHWAETEGSKLGVFSTGNAAGNQATAFICEFIATFFLMFLIWCIFSKGVGGTVGLAPGFGPHLVGMLIWALGLSLGGPTGYAMNAARDLGPRIAHAILPIPDKGDGNWGYAWVPVVAPLCGGVFAYVVASATGILG